MKGRQALRKQFFFEKKNQKTFIYLNTCRLYLNTCRLYRLRYQENKSFLFLFFKKEILPCVAGVSVSMRVGIRRQLFFERVAFVSLGFKHEGHEDHEERKEEARSSLR